MRSVTSYFNPTLYKKNLARFWPLWGFYLFCGLCVTAVLLLQRWLDYSGSSNQYKRVLDLAQDLPEMMPFLVWVSVVYCALCAMAVYSYLYNHRSACGIHALPMSRDTLFATNYLSGISFFLLPNVIISIVTLAVEMFLIQSQDWGTTLPRVLIICAALTGMEIFFFSFATFCAMVTGNTFALPVFYAIFNGLVVGICTILLVWAELLFYGVRFSGMPALVELCTPVYMFMSACQWESYGPVGAGMEWQELPASQHYLLSPETILAYTVVGLVFAVLALLVYRRRHIESAGDVIAFPFLYPLFRFGVGLCAGLTMGTGMTAFFGAQDSAVLSTLFIALWAIIGYFIAEMLLQKSFRVWKQWKGCLVTIAVCVALCISAHTDFLGIESLVPQPHEVESVSVHLSPTYPAYMGTVTFEEDDHISAIVQAHQSIVNNRKEYEKSHHVGYDEYCYLRLDYSLKNGKMLSRYYHFPAYYEELSDSTTPAAILNDFVSRKDVQYMAQHFEEFEEQRPVSGWIEYYKLLDEHSGRGEWVMENFDDAELIWAAVKQDFEAGHFGTLAIFNPDYDYVNHSEFERYKETLVSTTQSASVVPSKEYPTEVALQISFLPENFKYIDDDKEHAVGYTNYDCELTSECIYTIAALEALGVPLPDTLK